MAVSGHLWTAHGFLSSLLRPPVAPASRSWETVVEDERVGPVRLSGELSEPTGATALVVLVHGLGGCAQSPYVVAAAAAAVDAGVACLRLNLRGADRRGEDIYHGGLTADLEASLRSSEVAAYERIGLVGFSMGGHVALRFVLDSAGSEVGALATISPPLDLAAVARSVDAPSGWAYRRYLLRQLSQIYAAVARRRPLQASVEEVRRARSFVDFDGLVIAPRHGFRDAWDYYRRVSVGPDLERLRTPALLVAAKDDPLIPAASLRSYLEAAPRCLEVRWLERGGHLGFSDSLDLGLAGQAGLPAQLMGWLSRYL